MNNDKNFPSSYMSWRALKYVLHLEKQKKKEERCLHSKSNLRHPEGAHYLH